MAKRAWARPLARCLLPAAGLFLVGADAPTGGDPGSYAFVLTNIYIANGGEADRCEVPADGGLERFLKMLPPGERAQFATPDRRLALERKMNEHFGFRRLLLRGREAAATKLPAGLTPLSPITPEQAIEIGRLNGFPEGKGRLAFQRTTIVYSACSDPKDFPDLAKDFREYRGSVAAGIDLDGRAGKQDFLGPDGRPGIDNQLWRAVGCVKSFRESSNEEIARSAFESARAPTVIQVRGVENLHDDASVAIDIYAVNEEIPRNARGGALAKATFTADPDERLHASARGRIVNGVLESEPFDVVINYKEQIIDAPRHLRGTRVRARFKSDGSIEGALYGYYTLSSYYDFIEQMTQNGANLTGVSCPGIYQAIHRLADGYRDRRTGHFTAISSAHNFLGVRAFVVPSPAGAVKGGAR